MTNDEMKELQVGDIIRHVSQAFGFMVTGNFGTRVTAVLTVDITNPSEWEVGDLLESRHAAEVNRRRGEMAVARETLDELGIPKIEDGITLTMSQRINRLATSRVFR